MTNPVGPRANSLLGNASSLLGSAKEAVKAMTEAAAGSPSATAAAEAPAEPKPTGKGRLGTNLDRYA